MILGIKIKGSLIVLDTLNSVNIIMNLEHVTLLLNQSEVYKRKTRRMDDENIQHKPCTKLDEAKGDRKYEIL